MVMTWYYYLNYRVYKFYQRKKESIPVFTSFLLCSLFLHLNLLSVIGVIHFFRYLFFLGNKLYILLMMLSLAAFNYIVLYRNRKYKDVFHHFDRNRDLYRKWDLSVKIYIWGTIFLMFVVLIIADIRNHQ